MFLRNWARLYTHQTEAERALEFALCRRGLRYRTQHPFFGVPCIADFVLLDKRVVIEVDGPSHNQDKQKIKDLKHTIALNRLGFKVVRVQNDDVFKDPDAALDKVLDPIYLARLPSPEELLEALQDLSLTAALSPAKRKKRGPKPGRRSHTAEV